MKPRFWRLSEAGENNLGLACTADGLLLGRTPLIERRGARFVVRERTEVERLFDRAYQDAFAVDRIMHGLGTVAAALDADDQCLARIAAVHLCIPDLPDIAARAAMEAEEALIKYARGEEPETEWDPAKHPRTGAPPNPGWFAPTDGADNKSPPVRTAANEDPKRRTDANIARQDQLRIMRLTLRRAFRETILALLQLGGTGLLNLIPFVGEAADVAEAIEVLRTINEFRKLAVDARAALDFAKKGPHDLQDLQVTTNGYQQFPSYYQFVKKESWPWS